MPPDGSNSITENLSKADLTLLRKAFTDGIVWTPASGAVGRVTALQSLQLGRQLRDEWLFQFPLLPSAVLTYAHIAVSREWTVTGKPRAAAKAVDMLNSAQFIDATGNLHYGWHAFAFRRVLDWLTLGRNAFLVPRSGKILQYVDPVEVSQISTLSDQRDRVITSARKLSSTQAWEYAGGAWRRDELFMNYNAPVGGMGAAAAPLLTLLPSARMAYLVREHDTAKADGRKIRDIFFVASDDMLLALQKSLVAIVALHNGTDATKHKLPIVSAGIGASYDREIRVSDLFARMGIAEIDDAFNRSDFMLDYAQEIAAALDMPLRTFWNDPRGSNRALERVTNERSRRQGPSYYILGDERLINNSGILGNRVRFQYVEESDMGLLKDRADVAKTYAEAIDKLKTAIPQLSGQAAMAWLQQLGVLPRDEDLLDEIQTLTETPVQAEDMVDGDIELKLEEQAQENIERENEISAQQVEAAQQAIAGSSSTTTTADSSGDSSSKKDEEDSTDSETRAVRRYMRSQRQPDYGEVTLDAAGDIVDHRSKVFHISELMRDVVRSSRVVANLSGGSSSDEFEAGVDQIIAVFEHPELQ